MPAGLIHIGIENPVLISRRIERQQIISRAVHRIPGQETGTDRNLPRFSTVGVCHGFRFLCHAEICRRGQFLPVNVQCLAGVGHGACHGGGDIIAIGRDLKIVVSVAQILNLIGKVIDVTLLTIVRRIRGKRSIRRRTIIEHEVIVLRVCHRIRYGFGALPAEVGGLLQLCRRLGIDPSASFSCRTGQHCAVIARRPHLGGISAAGELLPGVPPLVAESGNGAVMLVFHSIAVNGNAVELRICYGIPDNGAGVERMLIGGAVAQVSLYGCRLGDKVHIGGRWQLFRRGDGHSFAPGAVGVFRGIQGDGLGADGKRGVGIILHEIFIDGEGWIAELQE